MVWAEHLDWCFCNSRFYYLTDHTYENAQHYTGDLAQRQYAKIH